MDIKLILENQLAIMRMLSAYRRDSDAEPPDLAQQIQKTRQRLMQWSIHSGVQ